MKFESVRSLKAEIREGILSALVRDDLPRRRLGVRATPVKGPLLPKTIALGVARHPANHSEFRLAVRVQHPLLWEAPEVDSIRRMAVNEVDLRFVGNIHPLQGSIYQGPCRPLIIGCSIGEVRTTAGTLGAFVVDRATGAIEILSNNHVLADENRAACGGQILQPGKFDNGEPVVDAVAYLSRFVPLAWETPNVVDCAAAAIRGAAEYDPSSLHQGRKLAGGRMAPITGPEIVHKVGRTTGFTTGTITAVEVDNITVNYDYGTALFDSQIEVQGIDKGPFAVGGDSGSLVFDDNNLAIGIVFGGALQGADNSLGLTYVNPLDPILNQLNVDLLY